jgi:hypothetical protein
VTTDIVGALWVVLGLQDDASAQLEAANAKMEKSTSKSVGKMSGSLTDWRDNVNKSNGEMAKWATAIGSYVAPAAAAVAIAVAEVNKFGNIADGINDLAYSTGLSTRKVQELQYAAAISNTQFSTVTGGIKLFTMAIVEAKDESSEAAKAFAALGVTTIGRSYDQIWEDTARAIASVEDETTRAALANTLYGRGWQEMVPYIHDYVQNADKIKGIDYLTDEQLEDLEEAKAQLDALGYKLTLVEGGVVAFFANLNSEGNKFEVEDTVLDRLLAGKGFQESFMPWQTPQEEPAKTPAKPPIPTNAADVASAIVEGMSATDAKAAYLERYTIPGLQKAYDALKASGVASAEDISAAYIQLQEAKEQLIRLTEDQTDSEKTLAKSVGDVRAEYQRLEDINRDFQREMSITNPRDVARIRDLNIRHQWAVEDQQRRIGDAEGAANAAPATAKPVAAAVTPSPVPIPAATTPPTVPGGYDNILEFYRANGLVPPAAAQAQIPAPAAPVPVPTREPAGNMNLPNITYGDIVLNIDSKMFTKVPGVAAGGNNLTADGLAARGIRVG